MSLEVSAVGEAVHSAEVLEERRVGGTHRQCGLVV